MRLEGSDPARQSARRPRGEMTPPEIALWLALRRKEVGLRFRRQYAAGPYVLDFYCARVKLAIEVDGEAHERGDRLRRDAVRDAWLHEQGVLTLRFTARDVLRNTEGVLCHIIATATERTASAPSVRLRRPPPPGGVG